MWIFLIVSIVILVDIVILMPKKTTKIEFYINILFMIILPWSIGVIINSKYNLWRLFQKGPDYPSMLIYIIVFPCFGVIFLNFYPCKQQTIINKTLYIFCSVLVLVGYDTLLIKFNILHYYRWTYVYSLLIYILELVCVLLNVKIVKYLDSVKAREGSGR